MYTNAYIHYHNGQHDVGLGDTVGVADTDADTDACFPPACFHSSIV